MDRPPPKSPPAPRRQRSPKRPPVGVERPAPRSGRFVVDQGVLARIAQYGNQSRHHEIHYALWRAITGTPGAGELGSEWVWDTMGTLASSFRRAVPEGVTERHYALQRLQTVLKAMDQQSRDPTKAGRVASHRFGVLREVLSQWESALQRYLDLHPECMLTADQWAGFSARPELNRNGLGDLGSKPQFLVDRAHAKRDGGEASDDPGG